MEKDCSFIGTNVDVAGICLRVKMSCIAGAKDSRVGKMKSAMIKGDWPTLNDRYTSLNAFWIWECSQSDVDISDSSFTTFPGL